MSDTKHLNPQVNVSRSTAARMWLIFSCAFLAVLQSSAGDSGNSFLIAFAALVCALMAELLMTYRTYQFGKIRDGSAAASALVLALLLPNQISPWYAALGAAFAMLVIKHGFGGLGSNWMNPALGGWLFIRFSWPYAFSQALTDSAGADPLPDILVPGNASVQLSMNAGSVDQMISGFLNQYILPFFNAALPQGYIDLFTMNSPGIIADRAGFSIVICVAIIAACQISRSWLSILYLAVFGLLVRILGDLPLWWNGDVIFSLLSGGTLITAFILVADPSSGAKSTQGNAVVVILAAVLGMIFRYFGNVLYGCFFAVALVNALTPLVRKVEHQLLYRQPSVNAGAEI